MLLRFLTLVHVCAAFQFKCPEPAQWSIRARGHCPDPSKYFCLRNDLINGYSENCTRFDFLFPGRKSVLRGGFDADICSQERYQPWPIRFYTNVSTNCIFLKSACNEDGQVVYNNGNRNTDITCRCDYTRGYDFLNKPRNPCFCDPSKEDCSCYLKMCQHSRYVLSPDYDCIHSAKNIPISQCQRIDSRINRESNQIDTEDKVQTQNISTAEKYIPTVAILIVSLAVIFLSYPLAKVFANWFREHYYFETDLTISPMEPFDGNTIFISCEIKLENIPATWYKDKSLITSTDRIQISVNKTKHILKITEANPSDDAVYCIDFGGVKRQTKLKVEGYFVTDLTITPNEPIEGNTLLISCEIKQENIVATWYKDQSLITSTDRIQFSVNKTKHILKITQAAPSDDAVYCIDFGGVKRQTKLEVEDYFATDLTIFPIKPIEGEEITISCEIKQENKIGTWYKDERDITSTDRMQLIRNDRKHILMITKADRIDDGVYCIDFGGVIRQQKLQVEAKYHVPLEIQNMDKTEKESYIKILETGTEKMYSIKIMILGKERVGKTSLMKNLLQEKIDEKESPTDGINIVKKCKVDIKSKQWIHCKNDTTDERVGRALRKSNEPDSLSQSLNTNNSRLQDTQNTTQSQTTTDHDAQMDGDKEGTKVSSNDLKETSGMVEQIEHDIGISNVFIQNNSKEDDSEKYVSQEIEKGTTQEDTELVKTEFIEATETDDIDTVLRKGFNARVYEKKYADCIIMDFAGHKEYYSTHQTFLTRNAVYLIVFSLMEGDPFAKTVDEEDNLGFWIDNIHCYAQRKHNNRQDEKDSGLKRTISQTPQTQHDAEKSNFQAQILMLCTGDDNPNDPKSVVKKKEWQKKFQKLRLINKRDPLICGSVKFISNTNPSASDFKELRDLIVEIAEKTPNWGMDYPVRWINLEKVLYDKRKKGINVLTFNDVKDEAMKCSVQISSEKEVTLFLKFQHEIGNLIFYDETELKNCVILKPSWLIDSFKCIVFADECKHFSHEQFTLPEFRQNGKIEKKVLRNMIEEKYPKYKGHLDEVQGVMKRFDIIVEDKSNSFICPSVITKGSYSFKTICDKENIKDTLCSRSPWLCMEFDFLPPALFNHLLVFCMRDSNFENAELFNGIGLFCIKGSNDLDKFFLCKSGRTIALQMFTRSENISNAQSLSKLILDKLESITNKYGFTVFYAPKIKCGKADYTSTDNRYCLEDIMQNCFGYCYHCQARHNYADFSSVWFKVFDADQNDIEDTQQIYDIHERINKHNYLKLVQLITYFGKDVLVDVLKARLPDANFGYAFNGMKNRIFQLLDNHGRQLLYPDGASYNGDLSDLDISVIYTILRNLNTISPPVKGWGNMPKDDDRSVSANIDRIRISKNLYVSHCSQSSLNENDFLQVWKNTRQCIIELGGDDYIRKIDTLLTSEINPLMEKELCSTYRSLKESKRQNGIIHLKTEESKEH